MANIVTEDDNIVVPYPPDEEEIDYRELYGEVLAPESLATPSRSHAGNFATGILTEVRRLFAEEPEDTSSVGTEKRSEPASDTFIGSENEATGSSVPHTISRPPLPLNEQPDRRHSIENAALDQHSARSTLNKFTQALNSGREKTKKRGGRTIDIEQHFKEVPNLPGSRGKQTFECKHCGFLVHNKKKRVKIFHLVICGELSYAQRGALYYTINDKDLPPLLQKTVVGMTTTMAWKAAKELKRTEVDESGSERVFDLSRIPRHARYVIAKNKLKANTRIIDCSEEEQRVGTNLLLETIIEENIPFSVCDYRGRVPRALLKLIGYLRPGFNVPLGYKVGNELLNQFYESTLQDVRRVLGDLLDNGHGTLMFDGSEDVNGAPMINFLIRVMDTGNMDTKTFFLGTEYTGYDTVDADYYVQVATKIVEQFVGFDAISAVVTDNTGSVKNAREKIQKLHGRVVASQDQAHVADRLMTDIGEIGWIRETINVLCQITTDVRRFRKMKARLVELMKEYNMTHSRQSTAENGTCVRGTTVRGGATSNMQESTTRDAGASAGHLSGEQEGENEVSDDENEPSNSSTDRVGLATCDAMLGNRGAQIDEDGDSETDEDTPMPSEDQDGTEEPEGHTSCSVPKDLRRRARMMRKVSAVRFATNEQLLSEYISLQPVLCQLVHDPLFERLYTVKNEMERTRRHERFISPILDGDFMIQVRQLHAIFHACRTYLRIFDAESCIVSEVFGSTRILEETLQKLPIDFFPVPKEENRQELLQVFANRKEGPLPGRKRIKVRLLSDLHVTAALLDPYRSPYREDEYMDAFTNHLENYLSGLDWNSLGVEERDRNEFREEMIAQYASVRSIWRRSGLLRDHSSVSGAESDARASDKSRKSRSPIAWWRAGYLRPRDPDDPFEKKAVKELKEFAQRTLSVSPTATATERTFSYESRIHTKQRASLNVRKVSKILFCQWNARVLRQYADRDELDNDSGLDEHNRNVAKLRRFRSAVRSAQEHAESMNASFHRQSGDPRAETANNEITYQDTPQCPSHREGDNPASRGQYDVNRGAQSRFPHPPPLPIPERVISTMPVMISPSVNSIPVTSETVRGWVLPIIPAVSAGSTYQAPGIAICRQAGEVLPSQQYTANYESMNAAGQTMPFLSDVRGPTTGHDELQNAQASPTNATPYENNQGSTNGVNVVPSEKELQPITETDRSPRRKRRRDTTC